MPKWIDVARGYIGSREIKGAKHNLHIVRWWQAIKSTIRDDEQPWCAAFVGGVLEECGIQSSRSAAARSYMKWGKNLVTPALGCIVVFWRGSPKSWSGHVGFLVGKDGAGNLMILGGNQGDEVNVKPFPISRVLAYRWPSKEFAPDNRELPLLASNRQISTNEA
jgi:uncharacterized protein (TIGR02594 family)